MSFKTASRGQSLHKNILSHTNMLILWISVRQIFSIKMFCFSLSITTITDGPISLSDED